MSNKKKNKPHASQSPSPPPQPDSLPPTTESEVDKRQDRRITRTQIGALATFLVSLASAYFSYQSNKEAEAANKIAQAAQDRVAGKILARFEFVQEKTRDTDRLKDFMRKKDGYDQKVFRIENVDELVRWGPHVRIKNNGTEPIDAIRPELNYVVGAAYGEGVKQIDPVPIVVNEISSHEITTFGKLMPGQTARIDLAPLFLHQISRLNWQDFSEKDHVGVFTVHVYCRLVGASSYDRAEDKQPMVFEFHWRPTGFKNDAKNVKELLDRKPWVKIEG